MARTRMAEPGFFLNERLAGLPPHARLLYIGLWQLADREGRLEDRPRRIQKEIFAYEDVDVDELLWILASRDGLGPKDDPFILRYEVDDLPLIGIPRFLKHQKPHIREAKSVLPPPAKGKLRVQEGAPKARPGPTLGKPRIDPARHGASSERGSTQGTPSANLGSAKASPRRPVLDPESVSDPDPDPRARDDQHQAVNGKNDPQAAEIVAFLREEYPQIDEPERSTLAWLKAYSSVDVLEQLQAARAHQVSNGSKHYDVPAAFLNKWLRSASEKASRSAPTSATSGLQQAEPGGRVWPGREESDRWRQEQRELGERVEKERLERKRKGLPSAAQEALAKARKGHNGAPKA